MLYTHDNAIMILEWDDIEEEWLMAKEDIKDVSLPRTMKVTGWVEDRYISVH